MYLPPLDAVVIATSNDSHHDLALAALDRGLHVPCEKPLARTAVEGEVMASRAAETGAIPMVPFTYHRPHSSIMALGQTDHLEVHGDSGTIYAACDWDTVQEVRALKRGESGPAQVVPIPDDIWNGVRRDTVHNTYRDVFRTTDAMTRGWISAIRDGVGVTPDFAEGQEVQRLLDAAVQSAAEHGAPKWPHC